MNDERPRVPPALEVYYCALGKSNKFWQMQDLTNDNYSDKLYSIFHIEYKVIGCITNKKEPAIAFPVHHKQGLPPCRQRSKQEDDSYLPLGYVLVAF